MTDPFADGVTDSMHVALRSVSSSLPAREAAALAQALPDDAQRAKYAKHCTRIAKALAQTEHVIALASCRSPRKPGVLALTNQRLLFAQKPDVITPMVLRQFPLANISSARPARDGLLVGRKEPGDELGFKMSPEVGESFVQRFEALGAERRAVTAAGQPLAESPQVSERLDRVDQLERLHKLREAGALSAQEFEAEKRRLLSSVDESPSVTRRADLAAKNFHSDLAAAHATAPPASAAPAWTVYTHRSCGGLYRVPTGSSFEGKNCPHCSKPLAPKPTKLQAWAQKQVAAGRTEEHPFKPGGLLDRYDRKTSAKDAARKERRSHMSAGGKAADIASEWLNPLDGMTLGRTNLVVPPPLTGGPASGMERAESREIQPTAEPTKRCPDCAETILEDARVCKHCGYRFGEEARQHAVDDV
jgi:hypothetical protein